MASAELRLPHRLPRCRTGRGDSAVGDKKRIGYFFPGIQVAEDVNPRLSKLPTYYDRSSVGTALVAGLASLIMYCVVVLRECATGRERRRLGGCPAPSTTKACSGPCSSSSSSI